MITPKRFSIVLLMILPFAAGCWLLEESEAADRPPPEPIEADEQPDDTAESETLCDDSGQPFGGGDGSEDDPYQICTAQHLHAVGKAEEYLDASFALFDDIDLSNVDKFRIIGDGDHGFSGRFDGNDHTIKSLTIDVAQRDDLDSDSRHMGLFGVVTDDGVIENTTLDDIHLSGAEDIGGLVGRNRGIITDSRVSGTIEAVATESFGGSDGVGGLAGANSSGKIVDSRSDVAVTGESPVGGLVGKNRSGDIRTSQATGEVTGSGSDIGGLVGDNATNSSDIVESRADGDVEGDLRVGGLVGRNKGTITDSHAGGDTTGDRRVGALVGEVEDRYEVHPGECGMGVQLAGGTAPGEVASSFATGSVDGRVDTGGLVGTNGGDVEASYWDWQTNGRTTGDGGEPLSTEQFGDEDNFEGWDFDEVWTIDETDDGAHRPALRSLDSPSERP